MQSPFDQHQLPRLMTLDAFAAQKTLAVKALMGDLNITPVYIPEGCTGYVQPLEYDIK